MEDGREFEPNAAQIVAIKHIMTKYGGNTERMSLNDLYGIVYDHFRVGDFDGQCRRRDLVRCRQMFIIIAYISFGYTYNQIGNRLSGRDHSSLIHSMTSLRKLLNTDESLRRDLDQICEKVGVPNPTVYQPRVKKVFVLTQQPTPIKIKELPQATFIRPKADHTNRNYLQEYGV